jgi:hypothetical protein
VHFIGSGWELFQPGDDNFFLIEKGAEVKFMGIGLVACRNCTMASTTSTSQIQGRAYFLHLFLHVCSCLVNPIEGLLH